MATAATHVPNLHPRLLNFFAKYPPQQYSAFATGQTIPTIRQRIATPGLKPLSATNAPKSETIPSIEAEISNVTQTVAGQGQALTETSESTSATQDDLAFNPFLPRKNHVTGRWRSPVYGLRQQADLFKIAREYGVEELLPPSIKSTEYKRRRALERGLAVKGTGEGQSVKGHKWERQISTTVEKRRKAMEEMPEMIRLWKQRGHGRGWKKYPK